MNKATPIAAPVVEIEGLSKSFGMTDALKNVSLSFPRGSIIGLIGRNGAGKTTLLRHITGLMVPSQGTVKTLGCPAEKLGAPELNRIGALDQEIRLLKWMTVEQHLRYVAGFYKHWDRGLEKDLLTRLELDTTPRVGKLSGGDTQKLALLLALCHRPELILLDEPVNAFDPIVRERILEYLLEALRERETTIVISSHVLHDVEKVVDRIVCLKKGCVIEHTPVDEIQERYSEWTFVIPQALRSTTFFYEPFIVRQTLKGKYGQLIVDSGASRLQDFCERHHVGVTARPLSLEESLLHLLEEK